MGRLPFELLCEIFHKIPRGWALEWNARGCPRPLVSYTCHSDPTVLGQVCPFRREVGTQNYGAPSWSLTPRNLRPIRLWLKRAGAALLDLTIYMPNEDSTYDARVILGRNWLATAIWLCDRYMFFLLPTTSKTGIRQIHAYSEWSLFIIPQSTWMGAILWYAPQNMEILFSI